MVMAIPFAVALLGLLGYLLVDNPKGAEVGRILFWVGLLVGLLRSAGQSVSLLR